MFKNMIKFHGQCSMESKGSCHVSNVCLWGEMVEQKSNAAHLGNPQVWFCMYAVFTKVLNGPCQHKSYSHMHFKKSIENMIIDVYIHKQAYWLLFTLTLYSTYRNTKCTGAAKTRQWKITRFQSLVLQCVTFIEGWASINSILWSTAILPHTVILKCTSSTPIATTTGWQLLKLFFSLKQQ